MTTKRNRKPRVRNNEQQVEINVETAPEQEPVTMSVFRMNKYDFVAAPSRQEAVEWYEETCGRVNREILCEMDIDTMGMWYPCKEFYPNEAQTRMSFREVLDKVGKSVPYLIDRIN